MDGNFDELISLNSAETVTITTPDIVNGAIRKIEVISEEFHGVNILLGNYQNDL